MWADNVWIEIPIGKDEIFGDLKDYGDKAHSRHDSMMTFYQASR
jgi:hypothetical protein